MQAASGKFSVVMTCPAGARRNDAAFPKKKPSYLILRQYKKYLSRRKYGGASRPSAASFLFAYVTFEPLSENWQLIL